MGRKSQKLNKENFDLLYEYSNLIKLILQF